LYNETAAAAPTVTTNAPTGLGTTTATLNGAAVPNGGSATGWFRYSTTNPNTCNDSFGTRVPSTAGTALGSGTGAVSYSRSLTQLIGGKTYYFCAIASNPSGTGFGAVLSFITGGNALRVGLSGMDGKIGQGPGSNTAQPIYRYLQVLSQPSSVDADIALADQLDIVLMISPARTRGLWTVGPNCSGPGAPGSFVWSCYEAQVRNFQSDTMFARAVAQRRVLLYVADEPNISSFNGTFTPALTNQAALLHKSIWPTGLTFVRITPSLMQTGWDNSGPLNAADWTGVDYGWVQYSGFTMRQGIKPQEQLATEKTIAMTLNIGVTASLNLWGAGISSDFDGVTACWDHDRDSGTPIGVVVGTSANLPPGMSEGDFIPCSSIPANINNVMANPDWIRHYADVMFQDPALPFAGLWTWPHPGVGVDWAEPYIDRTDLVSALDHEVDQGATRPSWSGYRPAK
jgi:hypothetical protein